MLEKQRPKGRSPILPFQDVRASMVRAARDGDRSHATNSESVTALENPMRRQKKGFEDCHKTREAIKRSNCFRQTPLLQNTMLVIRDNRWAKPRQF